MSGISPSIFCPATADLSGYSLVVAPMLYMLPESFGQEITRYVQSGGSFVTTYYSGMADLNDCLYPGGYPGILKDVCGLWVEETDALTANQHNRVKTDSALGGQDYSCGFMCDVIHLTGAKSLGVYAEDFYAGTPCICENSFALAGQFISAPSSKRAALMLCWITPCREPMLRLSSRLLPVWRSAYTRARSTVFSSSSIIRRTRVPLRFRPVGKRLRRSAGKRRTDTQRQGQRCSAAKIISPQNGLRVSSLSPFFMRPAHI